MNITLYTTTDAPNKINKTVVEVKQMQGKLRGEMNLLSPAIECEFDSLPKFNYVYLPDFNRYYFVTDIQIMRTHAYILYLAVDVLFTYKEDILKANATCDNGENANPYNAGSAHVIDSRRDENVIKFNDMFNQTGTIIMSGVTNITK